MVGESFLFYFCAVRFCTACSKIFVCLTQIGNLGYVHCTLYRPVLEFFFERTVFISFILVCIVHLILHKAVILYCRAVLAN